MNGAQNWHKWLVLLLVGLALSARSIGCDYSSITEKFGAEAVERCSEKCPFQNRTGEGHFDVNCGSECSLKHCKLGCSLWQQGLEHSCQISCNATSDTVFSRELYCVMGCNEALNTYFQKLRELIGTPTAPALVADSLTATSLSLTWEPRNLANMSYLVQWRYEELPGTWQYYSNTSHSDRSIINVENLRPYTKYRFRVAIFLSGRGGAVEPVYSEPSVVISTLESGKPSSSPSALRAAAPDPSRVAISWEPGQFPNGPLISYVLRLTDTQPNTIDALEDMPASNNTLFYMFQNLAPAREYEVSVAMRNAVGEGPPAVVRVSTPPLPMSIPSQQPILILGGEQNVLAAPANDMLSVPVELYSTEYNITGVSLDISSNSLFTSVSNGFVYRSDLSKKSVSKPILVPESELRNRTFKPLDLSVDWLNRHLYVLGEVNYTKEDGNKTWEIIRCDFDGKNQTVALSGFNSKPIHMEVDAYNGYLFYTLRGLYRLDLANISNNGVYHDVKAERIVNDTNLGAFTVDHADFRIFIAHLTRNTVLAVSLDGREVTDFRSNTQTPRFKSTRSIAYANGLFYWTNGKEMLTEEYHTQSDSYFHNEYPLAYNNKDIEIRQVLVALRSCQPIPVPVNPPLGVQSVMGINRAKVSWSPPHLLGHQGSGAWQQWTFHLRLTHAESGDVIDIENIKDFLYIVDNLKQDAKYVIRVAAVTKSGSGPWSTEFVGKTLASSPTTLHSTLIWSGPDGLLQTDLTGDNLQTLIHTHDLKNLQITDISWYRDKLYLVTNASTVMWYNTTTTKSGMMYNMDNVGSLAVDWVGKKIYWSNPKQQLITRGNFDGSNREPVPIVTVAKELTIDSLGAYIYWNTGHAVEAARLNGENKMVYYPAQLFSGKQVMGLTTDLEKKWLYWLVRSYDGSELHKAPTADTIAPGVNEISGTLVRQLSGSATLGSLCYFSGRLVWVADARRAVVSDMAGRYTADLQPGVHVIAVRDPTLHAHSESLIAIPETINASSIEVVGGWDRFNVTWAPAQRVNVNNSRVFYDVSLDFSEQNKIEKTVEVPWVEVEGSVAPYSGVEVTVRAHTAWGGGGAARARAHSPPAPPSAPRRPRLYLHPALSGGPLSATFRWSAPARPNGVVRGYEAQCWTVARGASGTRRSACADARLLPSHTQLLLRDLAPGSVYYFQVRANTDAGYGQYSEVVNASSDEINPIPRIMVSSQESIKILDLDTGEAETIPKSTGIPIDFAISIEENIVYWVNNMQEIFSSRINGSGHYKLITTNDSASSICVDWISRSMYFTQSEQDSFVMYRASLTSSGGRPHLSRVFSRPRPLYSLQVAPLHQSLFWYEESGHPGLGTLMISHIDGSNIRPFFNSTENLDPNYCNCPENPQVARSFSVDMTKGDNYELYWIDPWTHRIMAADMQGCECRTVLNATEKKKHGFTPMSITVDSKYVYWYNSTEREIYYTNKYKTTKVDHAKITYGYKIMALDPSNQKYPPRQCLFPKMQSLQPQIISNSASSITLKMPPIEKPNISICRDIQYEMCLPEYTIFYRDGTDSDASSCNKESCLSVMSSSSEVILSDLKPFTNYMVMVEATNYYAKLHRLKPIVGAPFVLKTAAEAPKAPENVSVVMLSPELVRVEWPPVPGLKYEMHWHRQSDHPNKYTERYTRGVERGEEGCVKMNTTANTTYRVSVRARSPHSAVPADSPSVLFTTYAHPAHITLRAAEPNKLRVAWSPRRIYQLYQISVEYTEVLTTSTDDWHECVNVSHNEWMASGLRPKKPYQFRLSLKYRADAPLYYWLDSNIFETLGTVPGPPGKATLELMPDTSLVRVRWPEPEPHGDPVTTYRVWGRPTNRDTHPNTNITQNISKMLPSNLPPNVNDEIKTLIINEGLELLHNGTEPYWLIRPDDLPSEYSVQMQGKNRYGWGPLSPRAELRSPAGRAPSAALPLSLAAMLALLLAAAAAVFYIAYNNRTNKKTAIENRMSTNPTRRTDAELLRLGPESCTNVIYDRGCCLSDAEINSLPTIPRHKITLYKFLGSGAFGEVYEGVARQINGSTADTKVAVKTLRKDATEQEKGEFLKEAALMVNFKHEHILRLLGVCRDNDPHYIIMELMEGGDLLSYLRTKRAALNTPESLTMLDLLNICVDVTKGCRYLEEMHFVHRDLACRNCLVAHGPKGRQVKIGDFGLARDIYKNDYYRKEGEGMLPVRWMAVECLIDGIFTCQSDVWAWGVLCWEVLSLGQQPYPAQTNHQVLTHVRSGGKPDRPPNCPSVFYELLQKCWSYKAEDRPSFRQCLEVVTALRDKTSPNITLTATPAPPPYYLTLLGDACSDAVDNRTYLLDENDNAYLDEDLEQEMEPSRLLPERSTKYVELMYDSDSAPGSVAMCDGYEVPRTALAYMPFARHSIVGVAPNRLIKPLYRTHSLRTSARPPNATIIPLRNGITKRSSLCEELSAGPSRDARLYPRRPRRPTLDLDFENHLFKTPF